MGGPWEIKAAAVLALTLAQTGGWGRRRVSLVRLGRLTVFKAGRAEDGEGADPVTQDKLSKAQTGGRRRRRTAE